MPALSGHEAALDAMASEGVVVLEDGQAAFFHASFFDYAFARMFASREEDLVDWLKQDCQDLFRRSQTRQILEFLRDHDLDGLSGNAVALAGRRVGALPPEAASARLAWAAS